MGIIGYIVIALAILYFGAILVFGALKAAGDIAQSTAATVGNLIEMFPIVVRRILGRANEGCNLNIHPKLTSEAGNNLRQDEIAAYASYKPKLQAFSLPATVHPSHPVLKQMWSQSWLTSTTKVKAEDIKSVLTYKLQPIDSLVQHALDKMSEGYPIEKPTKPKVIDPPKPPEPYTGLEIPEPSLQVPLWNDWRARYFNKYVYAQYDRHIKAVEAASIKRVQLLEIDKQQSIEIEKAYQDAQNRYTQAANAQAEEYKLAMAKWDIRHDQWDAEVKSIKKSLQEIIEPFNNGDNFPAQAGTILELTAFPSWMPREFEVRFDVETGILIVEHEFPDIGAIEWCKIVQLKSGGSEKPLNKTELKQAAETLYPALALRIACELANNMRGDDLKAIVLNGWANYTVKATGNQKRAYCTSLLTPVEALRELNLNQLDPVVAFNSLKGIVARSLELTPIAPTLRLDTNDSRFVDSKEVLGKMSSEQNLASMDWEDFEHLCRELFERVFASAGAVVKVTQASRDQGVDAIIMDPDPIRGGKIVIQAKRYINVVDVSAVRDLFGTVHNEGAMKGILVSTSGFGPESYAFIQGKPLTLINGNELLGLLNEHGYKYRINLSEARQMMSEANRVSPGGRYRGTTHTKSDEG
jgi:restriction system protein